ncbi:MAG: 3-oxoacyl-[acyl-carrier-protein] reductase [Bdellovibrionia bacterium]
MRLKGLHILVTGGSRGIGAAIAKQAAIEGAKVAITYNSNRESAEKVVREFPGEGHLVLAMNVGEEDSVKKAIAELLTHFPSIDGLVNNAGITKDQLMLRMKAEEFDNVINTNLRGTFLCTREVLKPMVKARKGSLVHITSVVGEMGNPGQANYCASKGGIESFSKSVALEVASRKIRSNCVAPGFIATDMTEKLTDDQKKAMMDRIPLGSIGDPSDVGAAVCFLLSDDSKYITGHTLSVNGGLYM